MRNDWINHAGGLQPEAARGVMVDVQYTEGGQNENIPSHCVTWTGVKSWRRHSEAPKAVSLSEIGAGSVQATLSERGKTHGDFTEQGGLSQNLKGMVRMDAAKWSKLSPAMRESIEMVLHKVSRIVNGNPNEPDHWRDIAGYATLVENILTTGKSHN